MKSHYKMKNRVHVVTCIIFFMAITAIATLLAAYFSFILANNIAEASSPLANSSSSPPLLLEGVISSLILDIPPFDIPLLTGNQSNDLKLFNITTVEKFILAGDWNITFSSISSVDINNNTALQVEGFEAHFIAVFEDGSGAHTHQISNFRPVRMNSSNAPAEADVNSSIHSNNMLTQEGNAYILGTVDVGIDGQKVWENVNANITVSEGRTIKIMLDENDVDYHFGKGQSIYGLVNTLTLRNPNNG
jgi:hypothetical protein